MAAASHAPWMRSQDVFECCKCRVDFNLFIRQHHCRRCGGVFCEDCSHFRCLVPEDELAVPPEGSSHDRGMDPSKPLRVCGPCATALFPLQDHLSSTVTKATQVLAVDPAAVARYRNAPLNFSMEHEIKKATFNLLNFLDAAAAGKQDGLKVTSCGVGGGGRAG